MGLPPLSRTARRSLLVEDDPVFTTIVNGWLRSRGVQVESAVTVAEALAAAERARYDVVYLDLNLDGEPGFELIDKLRRLQPQAGIIVVSANRDPELAASVIKAGAYDYVAKPFRPEQLERVTRELFARQDAQREAAESALGGHPELWFETENPAQSRLLDTADQAARSSCSILLRGPTGTGKSELAARIHMMSPRAANAFVRVNGAGLTEALAQNELFGHDKGAFTGASGASVGKVQQARGGSLFLDEIADMHPAVQGMVLTFLDHGLFSRVGDKSEHFADVRMIFATNRPLENDVALGRFREDLLYRIDVVTLTLLELRERPEDVIALARRFLRHFAARYDRDIVGFTNALEKLLVAYAWPGNVRQLSHVLERAVLLHPRERLDVEDVVLKPVEATPPAVAAKPARRPQPRRAAPTKPRVAKVIAASDTLEEAARKLKMSRSSLWRLRRSRKDD